MDSYFDSTDSRFRLYQGDTMQLLEECDETFDMIFADPPYFLSTGFTLKSGNRSKCFDKGEWDRARPIDEIDAFNMRWLSLCRRRLKESGTIWVTGTYHNIYSVANCMVRLGYKILNVVVWQKPDAPFTLSYKHFNFSAEYILWARKQKSVAHYFNYDLMTQLNGGRRMPDVWSIPIVEQWEKHCGKHPTQKPLRLLHRIILASTQPEEKILDPFAGSCTTGIAATLLDRQFVGFDRDEGYLELGRKRYMEIMQPAIVRRILRKLNENPLETMVMVNHARSELKAKMMTEGICYLRAGDSKGSLLVRPGFERLQYVLLHTGGEDCHMFRLKSKGCFQIWTVDTLREYGFTPEHAPYYVVLLFDNSHEVKLKKCPQLHQGQNTYVAKIRPLSEFRIEDR
jgi:site-specific DNA-methyltransferase (adenine-specific)